MGFSIEALSPLGRIFGAGRNRRNGRPEHTKPRQPVDTLKTLVDQYYIDYNAGIFPKIRINENPVPLGVSPSQWDQVRYHLGHADLELNPDLMEEVTRVYADLQNTQFFGGGPQRVDQSLISLALEQTGNEFMAFHYRAAHPVIFRYESQAMRMIKESGLNLTGVQAAELGITYSRLQQIQHETAGRLESEKVVFELAKDLTEDTKGFPPEEPVPAPTGTIFYQPQPAMV